MDLTTKLHFLYEPLKTAYPSLKEQKQGAEIKPLDPQKLLETLVEAIHSNQPRKFEEAVAVLLDILVNGEPVSEDPPAEEPEPEPVKAPAKKAATAKAESAEA